MNHRVDRDIDKIYPRQEFVAKLRRLADALETGEHPARTTISNKGRNDMPSFMTIDRRTMLA